MSTQAPAGTSAQPANTPAEAPKPEAAEAKPLKPIRKGLPGVIDHKNDPQDERLARFKAAKAAAKGSENLDPAITDTPPKRAEAAVSQSQGTDVPTKADGVPSTPEATDVAPADAAPTPFGGVIEIAGEKITNLDELKKFEHSHKTMKGMFKSTTQRAEKAEALVRDWARAYDTLKAEKSLPTQQTTQSSQSQPTQPGPAPLAGAKAQPTLADRLLEAVNPQVLKEVRERSGDDTAMLWALHKVAEMMEKDRESSFSERLKPFEEQKAMSSQVQRIVQTFNGVASLVDPATDEPLYPEFENAQFREAAIHAWREMQLPDEVAYSHKGVHAAYLVALDHFRRSGVNLSSRSIATPSQPTAATAEAIDKVAEAAANGMNGRHQAGVLGSTVVPAVRPAPGPQSAELEIRRRILAANAIHPKLGFAAKAPLYR